ncbi:MAG TPA: IS1595 family transposase [Acidobacteriaceae bacterium]|jgi:transposase-like protein|nr:IS1595 family transposase [Acidobacteriaceae bacterium]
MKDPNTLQEAIIYFADADNCLQYMAAHRWPNGVTCPTCGRADVTFLKTQRKWQCKSAHSKRQFTAKVGTVFEDSPLGLEKWLPAVWMVCNSKNGISSYEIARSLGVTQKTAWFMLHRIRTAMRNGSLLKMGGPESGPVEVDEVFVGPRPAKMHRERRLRMQTAEKGNQKTIVMGMLDRESRQVRAHVIPNVKRETLQNAILNNIEGGSTVYTDGWHGYDDLAAKQFVHETVTHLDEYVRGQVHTQGIENFWSLLKRTLRGTYVAVEPFHLDRYLDEQMFRYNNRATKENPLNDADRFAALLMQVADKRLTYAELTGKVGETTSF